MRHSLCYAIRPQKSYRFRLKRVPKMRLGCLWQTIGSIAAAALLTIFVMVAQGCSTNKTQAAEEAQAEQLPEVGTLDDYLAREDSDQYAYVAYGQYDPFMFDPLLFPPYWYAVPVYYVYRHHRYPWPPSSLVGRELRAGSIPTAAARTAATTPAGISSVKAFGGGPGGAVREPAGFGYAHMGGGGHR